MALLSGRRTPANSGIVGLWDDLQGPSMQGVGSAALSEKSYRDTPFRILTFRHDQDDALSFSYQFPHRWDYTTDVRFHLHLLPLADPAAPQDAYFTGAYAWSQPDGAAVPALVGWTTFAVPYTINPGAIYKQVLVPIATITPPAWARESTCLWIHLVRAGTNILDTYSTNATNAPVQGNLAIMSTDIHYQAAKHGTVSYTPTP